MARLLLVRVVDLLGSDLGESLRNDGDKQVQHDDHVEEAADEEDEPVALTIEFEVWIELAKCGQERLLPRGDIALQVKLVEIRVRINFLQRDLPFKHKHALNGQKGVSKS